MERKDMIKTLLFLYDELYNKSTNKFKYLIDVLNKISCCLLSLLQIQHQLHRHPS